MDVDKDLVRSKIVLRQKDEEKVQEESDEEDEWVQSKSLQCQNEEDEVQKQTEEEKDEVQPKTIQTQIEEEKFAQEKPLQRQNTEEEKLGYARLFRKQFDEEQSELAGALQKNSKKDEEPFHTDDRTDTSASLESSILASKGGGQSLPNQDKQFFEPRFGVDFSRVKIHTDSTASHLSRRLNAQAFTIGSNIYFGAGRYNPQTTEGKKLMGHELTHVVQQGGASSIQTKKCQNKNIVLLRPEITQHLSGTPKVQRGFWNDLWEGAKSVGSSVWNGVKSIGRSIGSGMGAAWDWIKGVGQSIGRGFMSAWSWIKGVGRTIGLGIMDAWEWVKGIGKVIGRGALAAWEWIKSVGRAIGRGVIAAWEWIKEVAVRIGKGLLEAWNWIKGLAGKIGRALLQVWEWLKRAGSAVWQCIKGIVVGAGSSGIQKKSITNGNLVPKIRSQPKTAMAKGKVKSHSLAMRSNMNISKRSQQPVVQRYAEDIHYYKTLEDALKVGYDPVQAATVAFEDQAVDTGWRHPWISTPLELLNPLVSGKDMLHFPSRGAAINDLNKAINNCDLKAFGAGLHRFQDTYSHNFTTWNIPLRRICSSLCWKLNPLLAAAILIPNPAYGRGAALKHSCLGFYPDEHNPEQQARDARMRTMTRAWLTRFLTECPHRAALKFTSQSFNKGTGGNLTVTPNANSARIRSARYSPSGEAKVEGGTDALAKDWEAGFIQTVKHTGRTAHYIGSKKYKTRRVTFPGAVRDALAAGGAPWYDPNNAIGTGRLAFKKTNSTLNVSLRDTPSTAASWKTPDKKGKLSHHDGKDIFTAWMITRKKTPKNHIEYLNWTSWEVDFRVTFNYATTGKKTVNKILGKTQNTGSGKGKGSDSPVLDGPIANNAATVVWS